MFRLLIAPAVLLLFTAGAMAVPDPGQPHSYQLAPPVDRSVLWDVERISRLEYPDPSLIHWLKRDPDYGYDVDHYDLALAVDFDTETIDCSATLSVTTNEPALTTIPVDLHNTLTVTSANVDGVPRPFTQLEEQVVVELAAPPPEGTPLTVALAYNGTPQAIGETKSFQFKEHDGIPICYTMSTPYSTFYDSVIPISHYWRACKDDLTDKSTFSCALTVPDTMTACANGLQTGMVDNGNGTRTFFWAHDYPVAPHLINLAVTNYQLIEDEYVGQGGSSPIVHFAWPEDLDDAVVEWSVTVPAMEAFAPLFGEYPFLGDKYGMCEVGDGPAIEHQTLTSMPSSLVTGSGSYDWLVAHELAHQWWGDCVTVADWDHVWLNEGFASYAEALWRESEGGFEALRDYMARISSWRFNCPVMPPPYIWHAVVYNKGSWVLHMLRRVYDDDTAFFQMLRDYRAAHEYSSVVTADFVAAAESGYGGELDWFFDPWLYQVGRPEYEYHWLTDADRSGSQALQLTIYQVQPLTMPTYRMPLDVRVTTDTGDEDFIIWNEERQETHTLTVSGEPLSVSLDPDGWVLADFFEARRMIVAGPGPSPDNPPMVRLFVAGSETPLVRQFQAYGPLHYGVNVSSGDVNGDGVDEILTGPGPGAVFGPHVRGFHGNGSPVQGLSFLAYGTNKFGVNVTTGNLNLNIYDEIVTGAGPGAVFGPHVRGFRFLLSGEVEQMSGVSFLAYGTHRWGVNVACGDLDGDGFDEIVTGAGPGAIFGPHVRGWNVDGEPAAPMPDVSFFAYGTHKYGVNVTCGDLDGDGMGEIVTGPGPGAVFGAHVRGWNHDGEAVTPMPGFSFFAWPPSWIHHGAEVFAGADLDRDGRDDLIVGPGPDPAVGTPVKVYRYDGGQVTEWLTFDAFPEGWTHGATVAGGRF